MTCKSELTSRHLHQFAQQTVYVSGRLTFGDPVFRKAEPGLVATLGTTPAPPPSCFAFQATHGAAMFSMEVAKCLSCIAQRATREVSGVALQSDLSCIARRATQEAGLFTIIQTHQI